MRSLIIITVVVITFIGISLIMPIRKDMQPGAAVTEQRMSTVAGTPSVHAAPHADGALTSKPDTVRNQSGGNHIAHKYHPSADRPTSL